MCVCVCLCKSSWCSLNACVWPLVPCNEKLSKTKQECSCFRITFWHCQLMNYHAVCFHCTTLLFITQPWMSKHFLRRHFLRRQLSESQKHWNFPVWSSKWWKGVQSRRSWNFQARREQKCVPLLIHGWLEKEFCWHCSYSFFIKDLS